MMVVRDYGDKEGNERDGVDKENKECLNEEDKYGNEEVK